MQIPTPRGRLLENRKLADFTWLRVGGPADYIFQPADFKDLADFLDTLPQELSIFPIGVGSNRTSLNSSFFTNTLPNCVTNPSSCFTV